ncbi:MAG: hypothetical protein ACR2NZ_17025, partial [Rubripirellula sp.]
MGSLGVIAIRVDVDAVRVGQKESLATTASRNRHKMREETVDSCFIMSKTQHSQDQPSCTESLLSNVTS